MESAITWAVVWGLAAFLTSGLVGWGIAVLIGGFGVLIDQEWLAVPGIVLGWLAAAAWFILCAVWCVQSIFTAIQAGGV